MRVKKVLLIVAMIAAVTLSAQTPPEPSPHERLAGLGRVWGYIKFTHPWIAQKSKEWDDALVAAIPKVKSATSAAEYAAAIDHMLSFLGDPATRRVAGFERAGDVIGSEPIPERPQPYIEWPDPDTAVITARDYAAIDGSATGQADLSRMIIEAGKAKSVVLDIRRQRDAKNKQRIGAAVTTALNNTLSRLVKDSVLLPSTRSLFHQGYTPHTGPSVYYSGYQTTSGGEFRIMASPVARPGHLVFIVNAGSADLYSLLTGLQEKGVASVVQDGAASPEAGGSFTYTRWVMRLPDNITLQIRKGELVRGDGTTGFTPDVVVTAAASGDADPARVAAVALSKRAPGDGARRVDAPAPAQRVPFADEAYAAMRYPTAEYRLLALFRFWNIIEHFFPYKELLDQPWEKTLHDFIPRMEQARDATEYTVAVAELVARIQDSHGLISSPLFDAYIGTHRPPVRLDPVEGQLVVTRIDEAAKGTVDLRMGDVVAAIDREDISTQRERLSKYIPASTPGSLHSGQARDVLRGTKDSELILTVRTPQGEVKDVKLVRSIAGANRAVEKRTDPVYAVRPDGLGYVDLDRLQADQVSAAYEAVKATPGLIIDLRGYIGTGALQFMAAMARIADQPSLLLGQIEYDGTSGEFRRKMWLNQTRKEPGAAPYRGKVAVLTSPVTVSAAESACMNLASIGLDVTFIGAPTTGANGNTTHAVLPGNIAARFTGMDVKWPDGRQLQRRGIQPDVDVRPTIQGVAAGRDEVLERAVLFLKGR